MSAAAVDAKDLPPSPGSCRLQVLAAAPHLQWTSCMRALAASSTKKAAEQRTEGHDCSRHLPSALHSSMLQLSAQMWQVQGRQTCSA